MNALTEKVLKSGLVDKATAELMEKWGYLEPGSSEKVAEKALEGATKDTLTKLADDLALEVEKEHALKETYLDLEKLRWPVEVRLLAAGSGAFDKPLTAVVDRMGRYYFRIQDVEQDWFIPGSHLERHSVKDGTVTETILEVQPLYIGDQGVCIQVTTGRR